MSAGDLFAGLRRIARDRAVRRPPVRPPSPRAAPSRRDASGLAALEGAMLVDVDGLAVFSVRRDVDGALPGTDLAAELRAALERLGSRDPEDCDAGLRPAIGCGAGEIAFLDLETTGFWGCPVFLVGLLLEEDGRLVTHQLLARDYPEEAGILRAAGRMLEGKRLLVTFNGKSYDVPCLRERAVVHRVPQRIDRMSHVDLLHPARRRFRERLPDCRLQTLEREVVGIFRSGDVPSREIPAVYHEFAATGNPYALRPVLHHSRVDLLTTARLFAELTAA